ncbi:MAG: HEAT repeat domain-containing protein, partial [bacterium]
VSFHDVPVREVVQHLVNDNNSIIIYRSEGDSADESTISQVWLLGTSDVIGGGEISVDNSIATAVEKDVKGHKLERLTRMLQEDQELSVRTRAAMAVGALQDERAVPALESALLDTHYSVRLQAIKALGRIGGERATTILGNILLQGGADTMERVMAAQALWKQDSEAARSYLHTGAYDTDQQVRMASSRQEKLEGQNINVQQGKKSKNIGTELLNTPTDVSANQ